MIGRSAIIEEADNVLASTGVKAFPVDPILIAAKNNIHVQAKDPGDVGVSGMLLRVGENFGILYATHVNNIGYQHFSVAHELGHYFLPGHVDGVLAGSEIHKSRAGFVSRDRFELEADEFAANLLMPRDLFKKEMRKCGEGLDSIIRLADTCGTSLTATAIQYVRYCDEPVAVVISTNKEIDFCIMSDALRSDYRLDWLSKDQVVPRRTVTFAFNSLEGRVEGALRDQNRTYLQDWFSGDLKADMFEQVIGLGSYGKTLTFLWDLETDDSDDGDEENDLVESWTPRFKK